MSWAIAANWLAVIGTLVLTFGTGAQAWANLAEFKSLQASVSEDASDAFKKTFPDVVVQLIPGERSSSPFRLAWMWLRLIRLLIAQTSIQWAIIMIPAGWPSSATRAAIRPSRWHGSSGPPKCGL
jgi:hypothetical protein